MMERAIHILMLCHSLLACADLYHEETKKKMMCRALNITEDLGQIEYIFSDKTGTLTQNKMIFHQCSIGGVHYSHSDKEEGRFYQDAAKVRAWRQAGPANDSCLLNAHPLHRWCLCRSFPGTRHCWTPLRRSKRRARAKPNLAR